jgi:hypothetical protein
MFLLIRSVRYWYIFGLIYNKTGRPEKMLKYHLNISINQLFTPDMRCDAMRCDAM